MANGRAPVDAFEADEQARRAYQQGRLDGLMEARDAVASVAIANLWPEEPTIAALAAIDALRGES